MPLKVLTVTLALGTCQHCGPEAVFIRTTHLLAWTCVNCGSRSDTDVDAAYREASAVLAWDPAELAQTYLGFIKG